VGDAPYIRGNGITISMDGVGGRKRGKKESAHILQEKKPEDFLKTRGER